MGEQGGGGVGYGRRSCGYKGNVCDEVDWGVCGVHVSAVERGCAGLHVERIGVGRERADRYTVRKLHWNLIGKKSRTVGQRQMYNAGRKNKMNTSI